MNLSHGISNFFFNCVRAGSECSIVILLESCQQTCMTYTIAVCTVKNSWWWTEELSETCRVSFQNKFANLVHLVGFIIRTCHEARSRERKKERNIRLWSVVFPQSLSTQNQINQLHTHQIPKLLIHIYIILQFAARSPRWRSFTFTHSCQNISFLSHQALPSSFSWFDNPNIIWRKNLKSSLLRNFRCPTITFCFSHPKALLTYRQ